MPDVVVAFGCTGKVRCYNGLTFKELWSVQLGDPAQPWTQRSIGSPSIGDVNGDGLLDVVVSAFDGYLYCFSGYDFRLSTVTLDSQRHPTFTWKSFGGTRYRVQYRDGSPIGPFTDIAASELLPFGFRQNCGSFLSLSGIFPSIALMFVPAATEAAPQK